MTNIERLALILGNARACMEDSDADVVSKHRAKIIHREASEIIKDLTGTVIEQKKDYNGPLGGVAEVPHGSTK